MLVDVVIPVYNGAQFLPRCLDSLLNQTYRNWRAIVVDDGSEDDSGKIADAYAEKDSRFSVIHKKNEGQYYARLNGVEASNGETVMFLDSDDRLTPECIQKIVNVFSSHKADVVMFLASVAGIDETEMFRIGDCFKKEGFVPKKEVCSILLTSHDLNSLWLKAYKRTLFEMESIKSESYKRARIGEDKIMQLPLFDKAEQIYFLKECLYLYTYSESSISHRYDTSRINSMLAPEMFEEVFRYMKIWDMDNRVTRRKVEVYYLRHLLSCYGKIRKGCTGKEDTRLFRRYPWKEKLIPGSAHYLYGKDLTVREKIKLLSMMI